MGKYIKQNILKLILIIASFIFKNIDDILIILGCGVLITALFLYVSVFCGLIGLAIILILFGLVLSKIKK